MSALPAWRAPSERIKTRGHQLFPVLDASQIDTAKRFASGPAHEFAPGEIVYDVGERNVPAWLVLKGSIDVVRRDGLNHEAAITSLGPGQFSGEVSQLAGAALGDVRAGSTKRVAAAVGEGAAVVSEIHHVVAAEPG